MAARGGVCCASHHSLFHSAFTGVVMLLSCRPYSASCPSVCMSVCPLRARNAKKHRKIPIGINVLQGTSKCNAKFQLKSSKVKVTGRQKSHEIAAYPAYMFTIYNRRRIKRRRLRRRLQTRPNLRPNLLPTPETLGNWTDGRISRQHSAPTSFLFKAFL